MRYKFAYAEQIPNGWKPVLDDGVTLTPFVEAVNDLLPAGRKLKAEDFVLVDLSC